MEQRLIEVAGNIGAGKSTLTKKLAKGLGLMAVFENADDNIFLENFYEDPEGWAFSLQDFLFTDRLRRYLEALASGKSVISDRSRDEDLKIFCRALTKSGVLTEGEFMNLQDTFYRLKGVQPKADLIIYLKCPPEILLPRIRARNRDMESGIDLSYLKLLDSFYEEEFPATNSTVWTIRSDEVDFYNDDDVFDRVKEKCAARLQIPLPA